MAVGGKAAGAFDDRAVEGAPGIRETHAPVTCSGHPFREGGTGLEQGDHLGERVDDDWTPANEIWTSYCRGSGFRGLWWGIAILERRFYEA